MKSILTLRQFSIAACLQRPGKAIPDAGHWIKSGLAVLLFLVAQGTWAQTFPSPSSCTSKDLLLVNATLPYAKCETCTPGTVVTKPLTLYINNKTGSTRTSFAFWATLIVIKSNGDTDVARSGPISKCFSTIPKNAITPYLYGDISFECGESLVLTNIWEAWTDAAPNSTCPTLLNNTAGISPKCGIVSSLNVIAGDAATISQVDQTCTSLGSLTVSPYGGTGPYKVALGNGTPVAVAIGGSTTFTGLAAGTYHIYITDANNCAPVDLSRTIKLTGSISAPVSGGDQTQCEQSPLQTLTASATVGSGQTLTWWDQATSGSQVSNPTLNAVSSVTYYAQASNGTCTSSRTGVKLTINAAPKAPVSGGNQTQCEQSPIQTLTATATGGTITWYDAATGGNLVTSPTKNTTGSVTYYAQASDGTCSSLSRTGVTLTINAAPKAPVSGGDQTQCEQSPIQTLTATATGGTITWYDAATGGNLVTSPTKNTTGSVTYYAQASDGTCTSLTRTGVTLTINAAPKAPVSGGDQTQCEQSPIQTLTATATGGTITWYDAATGGNLVTSPTWSSPGSVTYYAQASDGTCSSLTRTAVTLTINGAPAAPSVCVTQPSLCGPATGSVVITPTSGYMYSIDNGATWSSSNSFTSLAAGSVSGIKVKTSDGCISAAADCDASNCSTPTSNLRLSAPKAATETVAQTTSLDLTGSQTTVKAYPNPFNNRVKIQVYSPVSGSGTLDIYNTLGQKIKTIYQGYISKGINDFELQLPAQHNATLIYQFRMGTQQFTGKLLQLNQ